MFYRENGQFKTTYRADQQIFPITQDRIAIALILAVAFLAVPMLASDYLFRAILIPFLIFSLAAIGVNILVGYCGQISLGSGAFMAVGAYGAYNFFVRIPGMPLIPSLILGGLCATFFGILFGLPSLRVKGLYLAVATLAAQFFADWMFLRIKWFTNDSPSGSVSVSNLQVFGLEVETPLSKYFLCLGILVVIGLLAKNLVRGAIGREWMAIRDMDVAAAVIGIRPMYAKLSAFAVSSFIIGVAGALWGFVYLGALGTGGLLGGSVFPPAVHGDHRRHGFDHGQFLWRGLHRDSADRAESGTAPARYPVRSGDFHGGHLARRTDHFWRADRLVPDRRAAWPGQTVVASASKSFAFGPSPIDFRESFHANPGTFSCLNTRRRYETAHYCFGHLPGRRGSHGIRPGQGAILPRPALPHRPLCTQRRAVGQRLCRLPQAGECARRHQRRQDHSTKSAKPVTTPRVAWNATSA